MENTKAINIAVGCVMASNMESTEKREIINTLRTIEQTIENYQIKTLLIDNLQETRLQVLTDVNQEREKQNQKYGKQRHNNGTWLMILAEEFGEVAQAMQKEMFWGKSTDANNLYKELIQLAAVAVAIAEQVKEERP